MSSPKRPLPDLDLFALDPDETPEPARGGPTTPGPLPKLRRGELYLDRMPMAWVERGAPLPGRAWQLACAIWFEASCARGRPVRLSGRTRYRFGLTDSGTYRRALASLVREGLVRVQVRPGNAPLFTVQRP
jgi:hypothetical protein